MNLGTRKVACKNGVVKPDSARAAIGEIREQLKAVREAVARIESRLSEMESALASQPAQPARSHRPVRDASEPPAKLPPVAEQRPDIKWKIRRSR